MSYERLEAKFRLCLKDTQLSEGPAHPDPGRIWVRSLVDVENLDGTAGRIWLHVRVRACGGSAVWDVWAYVMQPAEAPTCDPCRMHRRAFMAAHDWDVLPAASTLLEGLAGALYAMNLY